MKKSKLIRTFCLVLVGLLFVALLGGCGNQNDQEKTPAGFSVGYGKADISPEKPVYLCGYGDPVAERMSTGVAERLYATCVSISDAKGVTVLLISLDLLNPMDSVVRPLREELAEQTGVPFDNIMVCCSHNHSGPDMRDPVYGALMKDRITEAVTQAMASRKPATMETAFTRPEGYNFVRHYLLTDGNFQGEAVGAVPKDQVYGHYGKADNLLQLVRFNREGDKPVVLMNWQGHPRGTEPNSHTTATPNYAGVMRSTVEKGLDCYGSFFLSGSGNLNNNSQIPSEVKHENYMVLGEALGQEAIAAAASFKAVNTGDIQMAVSYLGVDGQEASKGAPLYAISIGDVAFAFAPFEIFDTNAVAVKENSKFKMTFYSSCTNEKHSYLPTDPSYDWAQHYEVRVTQFPKGTAKVVETILSRLVDDCFTASGNTEAEKEEGYITPEFVPTCDGIAYLNPSAGDTTAYVKVANGFCRIVLLEGTTVKQFLTLNEEVAKEVLAQPTVKLLRNEQNVVVGIAQ